MAQTFRDKERETKRNQATYEYTQNLKIKNQSSIALLQAERAERVCSHTCKLRIIYSDTDTDREKDKETNADEETYLYTSVGSVPI